MTLRQKQSLFARNLAVLFHWIHSHTGWEITLADGHVAEKVGHMDDSNHYRALAQDFNLFIFGDWVSNGEHPAWLEIGEFWESLHPLNRWGGRFQEGYDPETNSPLEFTGKDSNHVSMLHAGRA